MGGWNFVVLEVRLFYVIIIRCCKNGSYDCNGFAPNKLILSKKKWMGQTREIFYFVVYFSVSRGI